MAFDSPSERPSSKTSVGTPQCGVQAPENVLTVGPVQDVKLAQLELDSELRG
ncbi:MAG TPA: hypothetical protein VEF89_26225 [Solirubrobacteraceae bacterium]|nr:hypothetical protein [Solirubrobacteraceae bacterium]